MGGQGVLQAKKKFSNFFPRATPGPSASFYKNQNLDNKFPATFHPHAAHEFDIKLTKFTVKKFQGRFFARGGNKKEIEILTISNLISSVSSHVFANVRT